MIDLHIHTARCGHAQGSVAAYVDSARARGVDIMAFTDHLPLPPSVLCADPRTHEYAMPESELGAYVDEVTEAAKHADERAPTILLGIEADHIPGEEEYTRTLLARYPFDVVLGSVHMIDGWTFDDPERIDGYARWEIAELWDRYFEQVAQAARCGMFDVLGHIDLVKKFRFVPDDDVERRYAALADAVAGAGVAIEVNTAGLHKPCHELYPAQALLRAFARVGVPATIGSDAHSPSEVGRDYEAATSALVDAGYRSVLVYERRVPREVGL